jgi:hypothetical protein
VIQIPCDVVRAALNEDFEFRHAARYWDASVRLGVGDQPLCVRIVGGEVAEIRPWATADSLDVGIDAPAQEWEKLLAPVPRPFYQSLFAAAAHHEVVLSGDPMESYAYMAALTRMLDVIRGHVEFH